MTSVTLDALWLTRAADLRDALVLRLMPGTTDAWNNADDVSEWAAGRFRAEGRDAIQQVWTPQLLMMDVPTMRQLQVRAGVLHWARDPWGGRIACTWAAPVTTFLGYVVQHEQQMASVALTLKSVTSSEVDLTPPYPGSRALAGVA